MAAALFFLDLGSPYVYLSAERMQRVMPEPPEWRPISLGAVFKATGRSSWGMSDARAEGMAEVERRAAEYRLPPVSWPDGWPGNYLMANRVAVVAARQGRVAEFVRCGLRRAFVAGRDLSDPDEVLGAARAAGLDPAEVREAVQRQDVKDELRAATDDALERGVIGVPTLAVGDELFWGDDRLEEAADVVRSSRR